jgi:hypothetical protein
MESLQYIPYPDAALHLFHLEMLLLYRSHQLAQGQGHQLQPHLLLFAATPPPAEKRDQTKMLLIEQHYD